MKLIVYPVIGVDWFRKYPTCVRSTRFVPVGGKLVLRIVTVRKGRLFGYRYIQVFRRSSLDALAERYYPHG